MKNFRLNFVRLFLSVFTLFFLLQTSQVALATSKITIANTSTNSIPATSDSDSVFNSISADGRFVAFDSDAKLTSDDTNSVKDIFLKDRLQDITVRVSKEANGDDFSHASIYPSVVSVGENLVRVAFSVDQEGKSFVKDFNPSNSLSLIQTINLADNLTGSPFRPKISANGNYVVFELGDQIYRKDLNNLTATPILVSCSSLTSPCSVGNFPSAYATISSNGDYVVFQSYADNLVANDTNNRLDIFFRKISSPTITERVSVNNIGNEGDFDSGSSGSNTNFAADVSDDGNYIVFSSSATNFTTGDTNGEWDIFLRNRSAQTTTYIGDKVSGATLNVRSKNPNMSADGRFITYERDESLIFYDHYIGTLAKINTVKLTNPQGLSQNTLMEISQNGRYISFSGQQLTYNGGNNNNVYVYDRISPAQRNVGDFDGDGATDLGVFRPSTGYWYASLSGSGSFFSSLLGTSTDILAQNDFTSDGVTDVAVFRPSNGTWYISSTSNATQFGQSGDIPVSADYDGDNKADIAVYRPSTGYWYILTSKNSGFLAVQFGTSGDKPMVGDFDRDGIADQAVFRPSTGIWYYTTSHNSGNSGIAFGQNGDIPIAADFDGDAQTDFAVFRPSNNSWYVQQSYLGFTGLQFGATSDQPVAGDYDNDGRTDFAVFRPSNGIWYQQRSTKGFTTAIFGQSGDIPIPFGN